MGCCAQSRENQIPPPNEDEKVEITSPQISDANTEIQRAVYKSLEALLLSGLKLLSKFDYSSDLTTAKQVTFLSEHFCHKNLKGFSLLIREKMALELFRAICSLLAYLQGEDLPLTNSDIDSILPQLETLSSFSFENRLGGVELSYFIEAILETLRAIRFLDKSNEYIGMDYLVGFGRLTLFCFRFPGGSDEIISQAINNACTVAKKSMKKNFVRKFISIQEISRQAITGSLQESEISLEKLLGMIQGETLKRTKIGCMLALKNICFIKESKTEFIETLVYLCQKNQDETVRALALRILLELKVEKKLDEIEEESVERTFSELSDGFHQETNLLIKSFLCKDQKEEMKKSLKNMHENWYCLTGIDKKVYETLLNESNREFSEFERTYVDLLCGESLEKGGEELAEERIKQFLASDKKVLLMMGNSGCGKSLLLKKLEYQMLLEKNKFFPVYFYLAEFSESVEGRLLEDGLNLIGINPSRELFRYRPVLFLLDAYDQLPKSVNLFKLNKIFTKFKNSKAIITSRTYYFLSIPSYTNLFFNEKVQELNISFIRDFVHSQVQLYCEKSFKQEAYKKLFSVENLMDFVSTPLMLKIVLEQINSLPEKRELSRSLLYENFLKIKREEVFKKLKSEKKGLENSEEDCINFCEDRAIEIISRIEIEDQELIMENKELIAGGPFTPYNNESKKIEFIHISIAEYIISEIFVKEINSLDKETVESSILNKIRIVENQGIIEFIVEQIDMNLKKRIFDIIRYSREFETEICASNLMSIWNRKFNFIDEDLSEIRAPYSDLSGGNLFGINFRGADLEESKMMNMTLVNVDLSHCNFNGIKPGQTPGFYNKKGKVKYVKFISSGTKLVLGSKRCIEIRDIQSQEVLLYEKAKKHKKFIDFYVYENEKYLIVCNEANELDIYSLKTFNVEDNLEEDIRDICSIAFSPDSKLFAVLEKNRTIQIFSIEEKREVKNFDIKQFFTKIKISPNGKIMALYSKKEDKICILDFNSGEEIGELEVPGESVTKIDFSPDGNKLVSSLSNGEIIIWDINQKIPWKSYKVHESRVTALKYSPDSSTIASGSEDSELFIWNIEKEQVVTSFKGSKISLTALDFTESGDQLVVCCENRLIKIWNLKEGVDLHKEEKDKDEIIDVKFLKDGNKLVSISKKYIYIWDAKDGSLIRTIKDQLENSNLINIASSGEKVIFQTEDLSLRVFSIENEEIDILFPSLNKITTADFSPDEKYFVFFDSGKIKVCNTLEEKISQKIDLETENEPLIVFSNNSNRIICSTNKGMVGVWNLEIEEAPLMLKGDSETISHLAFSSDDKLIASSRKFTIELLNAENGETVLEFAERDKEIQLLKFLDNDRLIMGVIWSTENGDLVHRLFGHHDRINSINLYKDSLKFVTGSYDKTIKVWNLEGCEMVSISNEEEKVSESEEDIEEGSEEDIGETSYECQNKSLAFICGKKRINYEIEENESRFSKMALSSEERFETMCPFLELSIGDNLSSYNVIDEGEIIEEMTKRLFEELKY